MLVGGLRIIYRDYQTNYSKLYCDLLGYSIVTFALREERGSIKIRTYATKGISCECEHLPISFFD